MSLAGRLDHIDLVEILHFLALNSRTGKLTLSRRDAQGTIVIRLGRVVYAASSSIRDTLGSLLVGRGLLTPEALADALERQHATPDRRKLGALLVETGAINDAQLQDVLRQQTAVVVQELCGWPSGYFRFEVAPVASSGEIGVDLEDLVITAGVATDQILLEAVTAADERRPHGGSGPNAHDVAAATPAPALRGELTAGFLRRAAAVVPRGLLMAVRGDEAQAVAQVGLDTLGDCDSLLRALRVPLGEPSVIADAVERVESWRGSLAPLPVHERLLELLGGARPREALVVPMLLHERAGLVFYGDDAAGDRALGDASEIEWGLLESALLMERDVLEARLREFESVRGYRP